MRRKHLKRTGSLKLVTQLPKGTPHPWQKPSQAERIPYPDTAKRNTKAHVRDIARKLAPDLEERNILPPHQGECRAGKSTLEHAVRFVFNVYKVTEEQQQQHQKRLLTVKVDLEDACIRAQFKILAQWLVSPLGCAGELRLLPLVGQTGYCHCFPWWDRLGTVTVSLGGTDWVLSLFPLVGQTGYCHCFPWWDRLGTVTVSLGGTDWVLSLFPLVGRSGPLFTFPLVNPF